MVNGNAVVHSPQTPVVNHKTLYGDTLPDTLSSQPTPDKSWFEQNLVKLQAHHHSHCCFQKKKPIDELRFSFDDKGTLFGLFTCTDEHQGYDNRVHGGLIAAIVDASMAQCLMGHGIAGYTTNLSITYRNPILINKPATIETSITSNHRGLLFLMQCEIFQDHTRAIHATGRFFKVK